MTPEELVVRLQKALPAGLRSVVLYGSAAAGDHIAGKSDFNVLVVADRLGLAELQALSAPAVAWARAGNRPPLLFTPEQLAASADAFPIELLDIQQSRRVLCGEDLLAAVRVNRAHLRLELEHEIKGKLLRLRESYLLTGGKPRRVMELLASSLSSFLVLFRAALRLWQDEVPVQKHEALALLARHIGFDATVFLTIKELKEGKRRGREVSADALFGQYLAAIEQVVDAVDRRLRAEKP